MTCDEIKGQYEMLSASLLAVNMSIQSTQGNIATTSLQLSVTDTVAAVPVQPYTQAVASARSQQLMMLVGQWGNLAELFTNLSGYQATAAQLQGQLTSLIQQWNDGGCQGAING